MISVSTLMFWCCVLFFVSSNGCAFVLPVNSRKTSIIRKEGGAIFHGSPPEIEKFPREKEFDEWEKKEKKREKAQQEEFEKLLQKMIQTDVTSLPSLLTQNLELLLSMRGFEGEELIEKAIKEAEQSGDRDYADRVGGAFEYMLTFLSEFVDQAKVMDDEVKDLLGKIVLVANSSSKNEEDFDEMMKNQKGNFTPAFLRHIEGECKRLELTQTKESARMLQIMRIIQTRVLEELGSDLGEGAQVLSQLLGYDDDDERNAVLEAGLTVRGPEFAVEMQELTKEAISGFEKYDGVDPELVRRVQSVDKGLETYLLEHNSQPWM